MPSASAQEKLAARARRVRTVRRRIVASILATFALAWGVVAFDGSMGAEPTTVASSPATTADTTTSSPESDDSSSSSSSDDGSALTTQQS